MKFAVTGWAWALTLRLSSRMVRELWPAIETTVCTLEMLDRLSRGEREPELPTIVLLNI